MKSWLLEFWFNPFILKEKLLADQFIKDVLEALKVTFGSLHQVYENKEMLVKHGFTCLYQIEGTCNILMQGTAEGLLTMDIHVLSKDYQAGEKVIKQLRHDMREIENVHKRATLEFDNLPTIKRGQQFSPYDKTSFGTLVEYDFDQLVFDQDSPYQNVRIMHSPQYGNCLVLDNDLNLAESDLAYTIAITGSSKEVYAGKNVLILGGGDGGILNYLSDKKAKMVTMIDIDRVVIDAAKVHLRGICGSSMDEEEGENYKIIVDDCVKFLVDYAAQGLKFDYIINDLTAVPISPEPVGSHWDFLRRILSLSMSVLKEDGKYFTQGNGSNNISALEMYEQQLAKLDCPVSFSKETVCVPSYLEMWVFYTLWKTKSEV